MCYSAKCEWENEFGECTLSRSELTLVKQKFGVNYLCPESDSNEDEARMHLAEEFLRHDRNTAKILLSW